jgi:hypothetical protein
MGTRGFAAAAHSLILNQLFLALVQRRTCGERCLAAQELVGAILERVWEAGDIYSSNYEGWYCVDCEEYKVGDPAHGCSLNPR